MADQKISALNSASTITGSEVIPIVQGGETKKSPALFPIILLSLDQMQVTDPTSYPEGQLFKIYSDDTSLPSGIEFVITKTVMESGNNQWDRNCECFVVALADWFPCWYDVATNKIVVEFEAKLLLTQSSTDPPIITVVKNDFATIATFSSYYHDVGSYYVLPSSALAASFTKVTAEIHGVVNMTSGSIVPPFGFVAAYYDTGSDLCKLGVSLADGTSVDDALIGVPLYIKAYISNL